jgi:hypothetical protein
MGKITPMLQQECIPCLYMAKLAVTGDREYPGVDFARTSAVAVAGHVGTLLAPKDQLNGSIF